MCNFCLSVLACTGLSRPTQETSKLLVCTTQKSAPSLSRVSVSVSNMKVTSVKSFVVLTGVFVCVFVCYTRNVFLVLASESLQDEEGCVKGRDTPHNYLLRCVSSTSI